MKKHALVRFASLVEYEKKQREAKLPQQSSSPPSFRRCLTHMLDLTEASKSTLGARLVSPKPKAHE